MFRKKQATSGFQYPPGLQECRFWRFNGAQGERAYRRIEARILEGQSLADTIENLDPKSGRPRSRSGLRPQTFGRVNAGDAVHPRGVVKGEVQAATNPEFKHLPRCVGDDLGAERTDRGKAAGAADNMREDMTFVE